MSHGYMLLVSSQPVVLWLSGMGLTRSSMYHYPDPLRGHITRCFYSRLFLARILGRRRPRPGVRHCVNSGEAASGHVPEE